MMDDLFELRSESKASYYSPLRLSLSPTDKNIQGNLTAESSSSINNLTLSNIKLPPLVLSNNDLTPTDLKFVKRVLKENENLEEQVDNIHSIKLNNSLQERDHNISINNNSKNVIITKHFSFDQSLYKKASTIRNLDTAVTIDILSESGRFSRHSLDPLTNRDTVSRFSSRPTSVKEPLFRKPSGKLKSLLNNENLPLKMSNSKLDENNTIDQEDYLNNPVNFEEYDDLINADSKDKLLVESINASLIDMTKPNKLNPIDESVNELMQANIKNLNLSEKPLKIENVLANTPTKSLTKLPSKQANKQTIILGKYNANNKGTISFNSKKPPSIESNNCNYQTKPFVNKSANTKQNINSNIPKSTNRSKSSDKPVLNIDLYNPTSNTQNINTPHPKTNETHNKTPNNNQKPPLNKLNSNSSLGINSKKPQYPTRLDSSRMEKNKKLFNEAINKHESLKSSEINSTHQNIINNNAESSLQTSTATSSNSNLLDVASATPKPTARSNLKLEINSSKIDLKERPLSGERSSVSSALTVRAHSANAKASPCDSNNLGQPSQPLICTMFEDYPQPFTAKSVHEVGNSGGSLVVAKKKKVKVCYKKNLKSRNLSSGNRSAKTKQKTSAGKTKPALNEEAAMEQQSNDDLRITNEHSTLMESDQNNHEEFEANYSSGYEETVDNCSFRASNGMGKSDLDINSKSFSYAFANMHAANLINSKFANGNNSKIDPNENSIKLKSELVKSVAEKVDAIYQKYNNLLNQQENLLIRSNKESFEEQNLKLNEQKTHFSQEMADELEKNIHFDEISSNPELIKRLKEVYALVKKNSMLPNIIQCCTNNIELQSPNDKFVKNETESVAKVNNRESGEGNITHQSENELNNKMNSIKSNADIREVFSIVNGLSRTNSINSSNRDAEMTFPPVAARAKKLYDNSFKSKNNTSYINSQLFQLPSTLSEKINTLIIPFQTNDRENTNENDHTAVNSQDSESNKNIINGLTTELISKSDENMKKLENLKLKFNYQNSLDSAGNDSNHSIPSDTNSISYHYDVKYRNSSKSPTINLQIENENDFQFHWKRGNLIGKGAFGLVYTAMLNTGAQIAVKQIEMEELDPNKARKEYENVREEVRILRELDHINIVQFMGTMLEKNIVNIFMELIPGGTIENLLKTYGPFDESLFQKFTSQILEGINYIHSRNVVHRDIKGKNIMIMANGIIKLIDFGCAKRLKKNQSSNSIKQLLKSLKGTPYWMSPEVIRETGHGSKADIWSTGATIFEMATGMPPWGELQPIAAIYAIGSGDTPPPELPSKFSFEARDFVRLCLIRNPDERPSAAQLLDHEFLKLNI